MSEDVDKPPRWSLARRMEFIEFRLVWEGRVNRGDIARVFDVSLQQASNDLARYEDLARDNLAYDRNAKTFIAAPGFRPRFLRAHADRYLLQLNAVGNGWIDPLDTWFDQRPPLAVAPTPMRKVETATLRRLLQAIRERLELTIQYNSMSGPEVSERSIAPHALGSDGSRWHVRAWSREHNDYRDFVLSRIVGLGDHRPAKVGGDFDYEWQESIDVELAPNPGLTRGRQLAIAREYEMTDERLRLPTRVALAFYLISRWNLDVPGLEPGRQQVVALNLDQISAARERTKAATAAALAGRPGG